MAFSASTLRHAQSFLAPKPLDLLVIHCPAFGAGVVIGRPKPSPGMMLGVLAKPVPQRGVRVIRCRGGGLAALGGAVLPGDAAGEPFADPQHALEVMNGCPPAFRA